MAWNLTNKAWKLIRQLVKDGQTILELGSGFTTSMLIKYYTVYSIEDNPQWVGKYGSNYIYAPILKYSDGYPPPNIPGLKKLNQKRQVGWYNPKIIKEALDEINYNFILIDGPKARIGRGGFFLHIDIFNNEVPMLFDDIVLESEFILLEKVSNYLKVPYFIISDNEDGKECKFGILNIKESELDGFEYEGPIYIS